MRHIPVQVVGPSIASGPALLLLTAGAGWPPPGEPPLPPSAPAGWSEPFGDGGPDLTYPSDAAREAALAAFQPMLPLRPEEYEALERDILDRGVQEEVAVDEERNVVLGHTRYRICRAHELPCPYRVIRGLSRREKLELAVKDNLLRRQVSPYGKAVALLAVVEARGIVLGAGGDHRSPATVARGTLRGLAEEYGLAQRTASRLLHLAHVLRTFPDLSALVERGEISPTQALRLVGARSQLGFGFPGSASRRPTAAEVIAAHGRLGKAAREARILAAADPAVALVAFGRLRAKRLGLADAPDDDTLRRYGAIEAREQAADLRTGAAALERVASHVPTAGLWELLATPGPDLPDPDGAHGASETMAVLP
ncbi:MAG TPA: ParB/RepB/Spo0J family partition protein [Candidatus Sulfotelmatobacter sp.]|nr:ParB/RepB/Spo0J family partition protein [Candidatus Sulfotelmatobacter sp.]